MVWYLSSWIELVNLSLIKSALPVSIPRFTLSDLKHAKHYFQTTLNSVTLSAVGCTGCTHHNGPFLKQTNHTVRSAEIFHDSSDILSPYPFCLNLLQLKRYSLASDWFEIALLLYRITSWSGYEWSSISTPEWSWSTSHWLNQHYRFPFQDLRSAT